MNFFSDKTIHAVECALQRTHEEAIEIDQRLRQDNFEPFVGCIATSAQVIVSEISVTTGGKLASGDEVIAPHIFRSSPNLPAVRGVALWRKAIEASTDGTIEPNQP